METPLLHTSVQAICHCIGTLGSLSLLHSPSGLYLKYCPGCGEKLQFQPLHTLVLTAFHLANSGCDDEDLFGMLACLLSLLSNGVEPSVTATISLAAILATNESDYCDHEALTPAELAERIPGELMRKWTTSSYVGWQVFCRVLRIAEQTSLEIADLGEEELQEYLEHGHGLGIQCDDFCVDLLYSFQNKYMGHIWAAVQAELLTYRRLDDHDPWNSEDFDMVTLLDIVHHLL